MKLLGALLSVSLLGLSVPARATTVFSTPLAGVGNSSGFATVTLNGQVGALEVIFSLSSPISAASGIYDSTETFLLYPLTIPSSPTTSGTIDQVINFASQDIPTLLDGDLYFDVTSQSFPGVPGEIGGELEAVVPEPAPIALLGLGLAWVVGLNLRRFRATSPLA